MSITKFYEDKVDPFHVYYDIDIVHQTEDDTPAPLSFNQTRSAPFLRNPEKYFMSIIRFNVTNSLPVFIPKIQLNQPNPNKTIYNMYISTQSPSASAIKVNFEWVCPNDAPIPNPDTAGNYTYQNIQNEYYYCYTIEYFLYLMNQQLQTKINTTPMSGAFENVWFSLNKDTYQLELNFISVDKSWRPRFYFNGPLRGLFSLFTYKYNGFNIPNYGNTTEKTFEILWERSNHNASLTKPQVTINTEACCLQRWNPVSAVVFTTTTLPVVASETGTPLVYGSNVKVGNVSSNNNISTIITDFTVSIGPNNLYAPEIDYLPTAEYRLNDMYGNQDLKNIDIQVSWKDKYGNYYPLMLPSGGKANIKIMYRKKNYNVNTKNIIV